MPIEIRVLERLRTPLDEYMIAYQIVDSDPPYLKEHPWTSPVAHIWIPAREYTAERERQELKRVLDEYVARRKLIPV